MIRRGLHAANTWWDRNAWHILAVMFVLLLCLVGLGYNRLSTKNDSEVRQRVVSDQQVKALSNALARQQAEARAGGTHVVAPPPSAILASPSPSVAVPILPTAAEIRPVVEQYCAEHGGCAKGPSMEAVLAGVAQYCATSKLCVGQPGKSADPVTVDQLLAVFQRYCQANGCKGADGQSATDDQVRQQVEAYCADDACKGPAGANGINGTNGMNGADGATGPTGPAGPEPCGVASPSASPSLSPTLEPVPSNSGEYYFKCVAPKSSSP